MPDGESSRIGRICPYAMQQCTLESGCVTHEGPIFGEDVLKLNFLALRCAKAGASLFASELRTGELKTGPNIVGKRGGLRVQRLKHIDGLLRAQRRVPDSEILTAATGAAAESQQEGP